MIYKKNPPITLTMNLTKSIQSSHPISFKHLLSHYTLLSPKWILLFKVSKQTLYYILLYHIHASWHVCIVFLPPITLLFAEAHYTIFHIPLFLPPTHIKYSPHHPVLNNHQYDVFFWHERLNLTCLKPDLQQSGSRTSQAMYHKIQTAPNMTTRIVQNPFSTVQLFHEYRLPEKPQILNIC